jgi:hypothetical protein
MCRSSRAPYAPKGALFYTLENPLPSLPSPPLKGRNLPQAARLLKGARFIEERARSLHIGSRRERRTRSILLAPFGGKQSPLRLEAARLRRERMCPASSPRSALPTPSPCRRVQERAARLAGSRGCGNYPVAA